MDGASELSTSVIPSTEHWLPSPDNVTSGFSDIEELEPSDLTIVASPDVAGRDVDKTVERTCEKIKLTATNVRSIIRVSVSSFYFHP